MDLTTAAGVAAYMQQTPAGNVAEWNRRLDEVKKANGGDYPSFWWRAVMQSGIHDSLFGTNFANRY